MQKMTRRIRPDEVFVALAALLLVFWPDPRSGQYGFEMGRWNNVSLVGGLTCLLGFTIDRYVRPLGNVLRMTGTAICLSLWIVTDWHFLTTTAMPSQRGLPAGVRNQLAPLYLLLTLYTIYSLCCTVARQWLGKSMAQASSDDRGSSPSPLDSPQRSHEDAYP